TSPAKCSSAPLSASTQKSTILFAVSLLSKASMDWCVLSLLLLMLGKDGLCQQEEVCSKSVINSCDDCIRSGPYCAWCQHLLHTPGQGTGPPRTPGLTPTSGTKATQHFRGDPPEPPTQASTSSPQQSEPGGITVGKGTLYFILGNQSLRGLEGGYPPELCTDPQPAQYTFRSHRPPDSVTLPGHSQKRVALSETSGRCQRSPSHPHTPGFFRNGTDSMNPHQPSADRGLRYSRDPQRHHERAPTEQPPLPAEAVRENLRQPREASPPLAAQDLEIHQTSMDRRHHTGPGR
ncbi:hypothetical protein ILYODFUR_027646, partial [Ilyodon furcidens]